MRPTSSSKGEIMHRGRVCATVMTGRQNPAHGQAHNGHEYCPLSILPEVYRFKRPNGVMAMTKKCCPRCEATAIPLTVSKTRMKNTSIIGVAHSLS